jgi:fumarate reductase flavoprotein subunit
MTRFHLSKRRFLTGLGATAGLIGLGQTYRAWAAGTYAVPEYAVDPDTLFDVIVVGAGNAGMPLAIWAARRGKVLVIEKAGDVGGTLFLSGGMMSAAGTNLQKRKGIEDSPQAHYDDTMRMGHGKANPDVLRLYVENAAAAVNWLEDIGLGYGADHPVLGVHAEFPTRRYQGGARGGLSILEVLLPEFVKAEAAGRIRVLLRTAAVELTQDRDKAVTGVVVEDKAGVRTQYHGRNIVLTAGGCMRSPAVFEKYHNKRLFGRTAYAYSMCQGIEIGVAAGAHVSGGDLYIAHRGAVLVDRAYPAPTLTTAAMDSRRRKPWEIEVNVHGRRYVAEDADIDTLERAQTDQPDMAAWVIWDQAIYDQAPPLMPRLPREQQMAHFANGHPMFARADTLEELARRMDLPAPALAATIESYNDAVAAQSDPLGRRHMPLPIARPPFYAIETHGTGVFSHAGLDIDGRLRVLDAAREPIKNLYAAGEVTGGWQCTGDVVVNGCMVTPAVTFGMLLGQKMLKI